MLWCRFLNKQQHLYPHISKFIKIMLVGDANQFVKGRRHVLNENRLCMQKARLNQVLIVKCNLPVL